MKKNISLFLFLVLNFFLSGIVISQDVAPNKNTHILETVNTLQFDRNIINPPSTEAALVNVIVGNNSASSNARAPQGSRLFANSKTIVTGAEMTASGFTGVVSSVGWRWNVPMPPAAAPPRSQTVATTGSIRVYMKDTVAGAIAVGGTFIDTNGVGYTKVIDGTISIPTGLAEINIDIPAGGPGTAPYTPGPGNGVLYIVVYKTTSAVSGLDAGVFPPTVFCRSSGGTQILYQSTTVPGSVGTASAFRPETRFGTSAVDILQIANIYALGRVPTPWGFPDTLCYRLKRVIADPRPVTIRIRIINIDPNQGNVKFDSTFQYTHQNSNPFDTLLRFVRPLNITNCKVDSIIVQALPYPNETAILNNTLTWRQRITCNAWNWADQGAPTDGGVGFNGGVGTFVASFRNTRPVPVPICAVDHCFFNLAGAGNQPYRIYIFGQGGTNAPGPLLYASPMLTSPPGTATPPQRVQYAINPPVQIPPNSRFYIGIVQKGTVNIAACYQNETPVKTGRFFFTVDTTGTGPWTDFGPTAAPFRLDICPLTTTNVNLGAWLEGFFNGSTMIPDTTYLEARQSTPPYALVETATSVLQSNGTATYPYCTLQCDVPYWFVLRHRNHVATWTNGAIQYDCNLQYDFRTAASKAFGSNQVFVPGSPGGFAIYTADVNQEGCVDLSDCALIDNDAANFVSGYVDTDVNGDMIVDISDLSYCDNNSFNFICQVTP
ncbi:MAG: hypothetical protein M3R36_18785 [Bacteroidota bacterium]|nr:hypothetical protein [Bacteroidota bacterium]